LPVVPLRGSLKKMFARSLMLFYSIQQYSFPEVTHFFSIPVAVNHIWGETSWGKRWDRLWGPPSLLHNGYHRFCVRNKSASPL